MRAPAESAFLPFSATSEYDCSGSSFGLPARSANRIRQAGHRICGYERHRLPLVVSEETNVFAPKRGTEQKHAPGTSIPTEVGANEPHGTSDSQLAEASRLVLSWSACPPRTANSRLLEDPYVDPSDRSHGIDPEVSLCTPTTLRTREKPGRTRSSADLSTRLVAAATRQAHHSASPKRHAA